MNPDPGLPSHQPDQLVVDLHHLETVLKMLTGLGITNGGIEEDESLGLALVSGLKTVPPGLRRNDPEPLEVNDILTLLRQRAAAERDGWVPIIGRNRNLDTIIGEGHKPTFASYPRRPVGQEIPGIPTGSAGDGVRIGMVDTATASAVPAGSPLPYRSGHGTFVHSLIARQAPAATICREDTLDPVTGRAFAWPVAQAIVKLVLADKVQVLNLSLGTFTPGGGPPLVLARAIERVAAHTLVVAAAGNHGLFTTFNRGRDQHSACWPAAIPPSVAVGAATASGGRPPWSPNLPWVAYTARGEDVVGDYLDGEVDVPDSGTVCFHGHAVWNGTSFAAATVSGAIASRISPTATPRETREALKVLADEHCLVKPFPLQP